MTSTRRGNTNHGSLGSLIVRLLAGGATATEAQLLATLPAVRGFTAREVRRSLQGLKLHGHIREVAPGSWAKATEARKAPGESARRRKAAFEARVIATRAAKFPKEN